MSQKQLDGDQVTTKEIDDFLSDAIKKRTHKSQNWDIRKKGSFIARKGVLFGMSVLLVIVTLSFGLVGAWIFGKAEFDKIIQLLDMLVISAFIPIFTLILGYIFGTSENRK